jgi:4-amino-4-deoxy-L-arabinose transferase-like glycosyltransferase
LIILGVNAPWFLLVSLKYPTFPEFFFLRNHWNRLLGDDAGHLHVHAEPFYYYLPVVLGGAFPWSLYAAGPWRRLLGEATLGSAARLAWSWLFTGLVFLSAVGGKLPTYVLPLFPALALIVAHRWEAIGEKDLPKAWRLGPALAVLLVAAAAVAVLTGLLLVRGDDEILSLLDRRPAVALCALLLTFPAWSLLELARGREARAFGALILMLLSVLLLAALLKIPFDRERSSEDLAQALRAAKRPGDTVVCAGGYYPLLSFHLGEPLYVYGSESELSYGSIELGERPDLFPDLDRLRAWVSGPGRVIIVVHETKRARLEQKLGRAFYPLEKVRGYLLISNQT